jgi:hypothetical protein
MKRLPVVREQFFGNAMVTKRPTNGYKSVPAGARVGISYAPENIEDFPLYATLCNPVRNA